MPHPMSLHMWTIRGRGVNCCSWGKSQASLPPKKQSKAPSKAKLPRDWADLQGGEMSTSLSVWTSSLAVGQEPWVLGLCVQGRREWERWGRAGSSCGVCLPGTTDGHHNGGPDVDGLVSSWPYRDAWLWGDHSSREPWWGQEMSRWKGIQLRPGALCGRVSS